MKRRNFLITTTLTTIGAATSAGGAPVGKQPGFRGSMSLTGNQVHFRHMSFAEALKVYFVADTHLWHSDEREAPYREYSARMAAAYHNTRHFQSREATNPQQSFEKVLEEAVNDKADLLVLGGDIFSYPSEAAIEWAYELVMRSRIPFVYTAGNHDWHYEGMEGSSATLREQWCRKRLGVFYQGDEPLMSYRDVKGVRFILIDNSTYEISREQYDFFIAKSNTQLPVVLIMHIPLYAPGRRLGFGCGHPDWSAKADENFEIERRPRWRESGHTDVTMKFHKKVFDTPNLLGVFAGHTHTQSLDMINGIPQIVTAANADGGFLNIQFSSSGIT